MTYGTCPADPPDHVRTNGLGHTVYVTQATTRFDHLVVDQPGDHQEPAPSHLWMSVDELYAIADGSTSDEAARFRQLGHLLTIHTEDPDETGILAAITVALTEETCLQMMNMALDALMHIRSLGR